MSAIELHIIWDVRGKITFKVNLVSVVCTKYNPQL